MSTTAPSARSVFLEAIELDQAADRRALLDQDCQGNPELRREVEQLLAAHFEAGSFLESPPQLPTLPWIDTGPAEPPGALFGPYRLIEPIGVGGMGVVYRAEQIEPIRREVALKVIKPGFDTARVIARFEAERQALAIMDHPSIARVYDAGATPAGSPYFAMELVHGQPITAYCDAQRLSIPDRLDLFVLVCRAVQHAHQKGVIHRDLKPSNILVTDQDGVPVPKIIDFGVARATAAVPDPDTDETGWAQVVGTPMYMSPEQADPANPDIDTRSDIYSLGVVLYELVAGVGPLEPSALAGSSLDQICRTVHDHTPLRPSSRLGQLESIAIQEIAAARRLDPRRLRHALADELDWVVMRCLEKDRTRRYQSASALADDLMRYLTDRPVEAGPPSRRYRWTKFARRNRVALLTSSLVVLTMIAGTATSTWQAYRATAAESRAAIALRRSEDQRALARRALDALFDEAFDRWCSPHTMRFAPLPRPFLERALPFYEGFADPRRIDPAVGQAHRRVGEILAQLGEPRSLEALERSVVIFETLLAADPDDRESLDRLADSYASLANYGWQYEAIATWQKDLVRRLPDEPRYQVQLAATRLGQGILAWGLEDLPLVDKHFSEARRVLEPLVVSETSDPYARNVLGHILRDLANAHRDLGGTLDVEATYWQALALHETLVAQYPTRPHFQLNLAWDCWELGRYHLRIGAYKEAERYAERAANLLEGLSNDYPRIGGYGHYLLRGQAERAAVRLATGRAAEAGPILSRIEADPDSQLAAECLAQVGWYLIQDDGHDPGDPSRAIELASRALRLHPGDRDSRYVLALACYRAGQWDAALAALDDLPPPTPSWTGAYRLTKGPPYEDLLRAMVLARRGEAAPARVLYDRSTAWMREHRRQDPILLRFRDEAAAVLGLAPDPMPTGPDAFAP